MNQKQTQEIIDYAMINDELVSVSFNGVAQDNSPCLIEDCDNKAITMETGQLIQIKDIEWIEVA